MNLLLAFALTACATTPPSAHAPIDARLDDARVMFVGAHPDDETLAGPILARACVAKQRPCRIVIMTRGEGGRCSTIVGCGENLGSARAAEMKRAAQAYGAELSQFRYPNAPLPWSSFPSVDEARTMWTRGGQPLAELVREIERFRPTIILTFDPRDGFTDHPEHKLVAQLTLEAVARVRSTASVYEVLNKHWLPRLVGDGDAADETETFDTHTPCRRKRGTCLDVALEVTKLHATQAKDMGLVRWLRPQMGTLYLRRVDDIAAELERSRSAP